MSISRIRGNMLSQYQHKSFLSTATAYSFNLKPCFLLARLIELIAIDVSLQALPYNHIQDCIDMQDASFHVEIDDQSIVRVPETEGVEKSGLYFASFKL
ncbi:MAG: hypothetical protein Q9194_007271 [Teloschistes cf. exilis]